MNNRGSVMIFVLIVITFCVAVAMLINENSTDDFIKSNELKNYYQSTIYASTAVKGVRAFLEDDDNHNIDSIDDNWANIPTTTIDDGFIHITTYMLNSKISLSGLLNNDDNIRLRTERAVAKLFNDNEIADGTPEMIRDWMDSDTDTSDNGIEDHIYSDKGVNFKTKNAPLDTLLELSYFMDNNVFNLLKNSLNPIDDTKYLNINLVKADTLVAYLPELEPFVEDIISYRENKIYSNKSQILKAAPEAKSIYTTIDDFIGVKSTFIYTLIEVNINDVSRYYHALIKRKSNKKTDLITFFEGGNELYY